MIKYILIFLLSLAGCQKREASDGSCWFQENGKLKVLSTVAMIDDLVKEIGGERVDALCLIRGELDPHSYEIVKGDDEKFARADLIFFNGLGLEHGLSLRQHLEKNPKALAVTEALLKESPSPILFADESHEDPHVWMDISLWARVVDPIVQALEKKCPEGAVEFKQRGCELKKRMQAVDEEAFSLLQAIPAEKRYLVTSHDAFHYFARRYLAEPEEKNWQKRCRAPEGLSPDSQLSVTDLLTIMSHIELFSIRVVFPESNISRDSLKKLASACQERGFTLNICDEKLYADAMGTASSYTQMISHNVHVIAKGLNQS